MSSSALKIHDQINLSGIHTMFKTFFFSLILTILSSFSLQGEILTAIYPKQSVNDTRDLYKIELLEKAFAKAAEKYGRTELIPSESVMNEARMMAIMRNRSGDVNLIFKPTNEERETFMIPIRIPVMKGLLGNRIFLIHKDKQKLFSEVKTLDDLRKFIAGQGRGWLDVKIFEHNNIEVMQANSYESLFKMTVYNRFDYFSRGITEAKFEWQERHTELPDLHIEESILLYYPFPVYFFTVKTEEGKKLAMRLEYGLKQLIGDGTFDKVFEKYHRNIFKGYNLKQRTRIEIKNPFLPDSVPFENKKYWLDISKL